MTEHYEFLKAINCHAHLRQKELQQAVIDHFSIYDHVLCMGNTDPILDTVEKVVNYETGLFHNKPQFKPHICMMLTDKTTPETIYAAHNAGIKFIKFIPVGTSTGAVRGVRLLDYKKLKPIFEAISKCDMHLLLHGELISYKEGQELPLLLREKQAIPILECYTEDHPHMKITIEHASTAAMINFVKRCDSRHVRATLTPHHALLSYDDAYDEHANIVNSYNHCLPCLKSKADQQAVAAAMVSGDKHFMYGTDAAPHWIHDKEKEGPNAGIFFGKYEYLRCLELFDQAGALDNFETFTVLNGTEFYGFSPSKKTIRVKKEEWIQPEIVKDIRLCMGGKTLTWNFA